MLGGIGGRRRRGLQRPPGKPLIEVSMGRVQCCMIQLTIKGKIPERRESKIRIELKILYDNNNTKEEVETGI